jgi:RNA polymerase sigma factor (sigma-70 family)
MKLRRKPGQQMLQSIDEMSDEQGDAVWDQFPDMTPSPEEACRKTEFRELLHTQLKCLPSSFREVLQFYMDGLTAKEAAQVLGITQSALKCRLGRARAQLASNIPK